MFWRKKKTVPQEEDAELPKKKKRHIIRNFLAVIGTTLLLLILATGIALYWLCQTKSGQNWLVAKANSALSLPPDKQGMGFKLTSLEGSLPFNIRFGLEASDGRGVWLSAPDNIFTFNWRELPGKVHISALRLNNVDLTRLPVLPPDTTPPEPAKPFGLADLQHLLKEGTDFLDREHWWMPDILVENVALGNALLPAELVPQANKNTRTVLNASMHISFLKNTLDMRTTAEFRNAEGQPVSLPSFAFDAASINLDLNAGPAAGGLASKVNLNASISRPNVEMKDFPSGFIGDTIKLDLGLLANAVTSPGKESATVSLTGPDLQAGHLEMTGKGKWENGTGWQAGNLDGAVNYELALTAMPASADFLSSSPGSPFAIARKPLHINFSLAGLLPVLDLALGLDCAELASAGHIVENLAFSAKIPRLDLPLAPIGMPALEKEHHCNLALSAAVDKEKIDLATQAFFQTIPAKQGATNTSTNPKDSWHVGLRDLKLTALGLVASGNLAAALPSDAKPAVNGTLSMEVASWNGIEKFVPDQKLAGDVRLALDLANKTGRQDAHARLDIPAFSMTPEKGGSGVRVRSIEADIRANDVFAIPVVDATINAGEIAAAGMNLGAKILAKGSIDGPLNAEISTTGNIVSKIAATWSPGEAVLRACNVDLTVPPAMSPSGKASRLGIHSMVPATIHYGDGGIAVDRLDIKIQPSGRLSAHGALSPDKLSFNLKLSDLNFKPWQSLVPQIPSGSANITAALSGTPAKPGGNFNVSLKNVSIPNSPLQPFGLTLKGIVENSGANSALKASLALDPKSLQALGGSNANVTASIPLLFGADGIPAPNMDGNVAAKVRWDGALGPIWNLLPIPDRRLNGRLAIDLDASGPLRAPHIKGGININKARYEDLLLGILLTDINVRLGLSEKSPAGARKPGPLDSLPGSLTLAVNISDGRGGSIEVNGGGALDGNDLDIKAKINHLRPLRRRDVHVELSGNAAVSGSATSPVIDGEIIVNQGEVLLNNIAFTGSVTTLPISDDKKKTKNNETPPPAAENAPAQNAGSLNVRINMLPRFTVEGRGLTSIWEAHLLVSGTPANPQITGNISSVKGNFDFLGKNFALTKGVVFFGGGSLSNPLLDMELTNETPDLIAHILVTGPVSKIKLTMSSDPEMPRDEILSRVLFGRSVGDLSRLEALQLAAAVAQLAGFGGGSSILNLAKKSLGVDVLRLGTSSSDAAGEPGDQTAGGTTIEMGKYINDMIYMGVQQGMKADSTAFIIQMELTPRTNLEVRTEQNNTWGGLKWKYNY